MSPALSNLSPCSHIEPIHSNAASPSCHSHTHTHNALCPFQGSSREMECCYWDLLPSPPSPRKGSSPSLPPSYGRELSPGRALGKSGLRQASFSPSAHYPRRQIREEFGAGRIWGEAHLGSIFPSGEEGPVSPFCAPGALTVNRRGTIPGNGE